MKSLSQTEIVGICGPNGIQRLKSAATGVAFAWAKAAKLFRCERGDDFLKARIAAQRIPKGE
jgi:hypothetical protein